MNQKEFVDLCIMCGCDYTQTISGMGPVTAYKFIKECGDIEGVLEKVKELNEDPSKKRKYVVPGQFLYKESRALFLNPDVRTDKEQLKTELVQQPPKEEELKEWLIGSKGFTEVKVHNGIERLNKCQGKKNQSRLDSFFKAAMISSSKKVEAPGKGKAGKAGKGGKPVKGAARKTMS